MLNIEVKDRQFKTLKEENEAVIAQLKLLGVKITNYKPYLGTPFVEQVINYELNNAINLCDGKSDFYVKGKSDALRKVLLEVQDSNAKYDFSEFGATIPVRQQHLLSDLWRFNCWRRSKQVFRYDEDCFNALWENNEWNKNTVEWLDKLFKYPMVWIENSFPHNFYENIKSFGVIVDTVGGYEDEGKYFAVFAQAGDRLIDSTVLCCVKLNELKDYLEQDTTDCIRRVINVILYLIVDNKDVRMVEKRTSAKKINKTERKSDVKTTEVGVRFGETIRATRVKYETSGEHKKTSAKTPHFRSGHYSHFWVGKGREELVVRYISPLYIGGSGRKEKPITVHKVVKGE